MFIVSMVPTRDGPGVHVSVILLPALKTSPWRGLLRPGIRQGRQCEETNEKRGSDRENIEAAFSTKHKMQRGEKIIFVQGKTYSVRE